jgi:hypothetical protein
MLNGMVSSSKLRWCLTFTTFNLIMEKHYPTLQLNLRNGNHFLSFSTMIIFLIE